MKNLGLLVLFVAMVSYSFAQLDGSRHDFIDGPGDNAWNTMASNKMCGPCHTPHNAPEAATGPLWSHAMSGQSFTQYTSPFLTLNGTLSAPSGVSLYCLSCHDGVTNINAHTWGDNDVAMGAVPANVGINLGNDHPVSITYTDVTAGADGELYDPLTQTSTITGGTTIDADLLFGGSVECASCHDVHNNVAAGATKMVHVLNTNSQLCLICHNK